MHEQIIAEKLEHIEGQLDTLTRLITGNGHPSDGLVVRVDRLEQNHTRTKWWHRSTIATIIAAAVGYLIDRMR